MIRRFLLSVVVSASVFCSGAGSALAADYKVGFVNTARVLKEAPQAEAARKRLESAFAPREQKIIKMQKGLQKLEDKLAKDSAIMSDLQRKQAQRKFKTQEREIKRAKEEFNEDLNLRRNEELNKLQKLVFETIVSLAQEKDYDAILGESIYASERVDVTDQVLGRLRKEFRQKTGSGNSGE